MGHMLALCAALAMMLTLAYAGPYIGERDLLKGEFFTLAMFVLLGISVMISANNFLVIYVGLELMSLSLYALAALRRFGDAVYLHQVVQRGPDGLQRFADLPEAFAALPPVRTGHEWRVHFHVPIFLDRLAPFASTQAFVREVLALQRQQPVSAHLEVETYTWDVLPEPFRSGTVDEAVARELAWARTELTA